MSGWDQPPQPSARKGRSGSAARLSGLSPAGHAVQAASSIVLVLAYSRHKATASARSDTQRSLFTSLHSPMLRAESSLPIQKAATIGTFGMRRRSRRTANRAWATPQIRIEERQDDELRARLAQVGEGVVGQACRWFDMRADRLPAQEVGQEMSGRLVERRAAGRCREPPCRAATPDR